jgi:hypothetical protein
VTAAHYQRPGARQKLREALVDPRQMPNLREKLTEKLGGMFAAILKYLHKHEIELLAGAGKVAINDNLVWTLVRETLEQLFDRAAKNPWRKLPKNQPKPQFVCEACHPEAPPAPHVCPAGRLNRMRYKSVAQRKAEAEAVEPDCAEKHGKLPIELRMYALGLHENAERPTID